MIKPIWLKKTVPLNGIPLEIEVSTIDVAIKLNELIEAYNKHTHEVNLGFDLDMDMSDIVTTNPPTNQEEPRE